MDCKVSQKMPVAMSKSPLFKTSRELLWYAVSRGKLQLVSSLLKQGSKVEDALDLSCEHPIRLVFCRVASKPRKELLQLLIRHGLDLSTLRNRSLLNQFVRFFTESGDKDAVDVAVTLVDSGVPVDEPDTQGCSPLHWAVVKRHKGLVEFLIKMGADVNRKSGPTGTFPLLVAARNGNGDVVGLLLAAGADVNAKDGSGWTALHAACDRRLKEIVGMLVDNGADVGALEKHGRSPFDMLEPC